MRPGGFGISPMIDRLVTDLPEPDSPTTASVSPVFSANETSSTDLTTPASVKKWVRRCFTCNNGTAVCAAFAIIITSLSTLRIEQVQSTVCEHRHDHVALRSFVSRRLRKAVDCGYRHDHIAFRNFGSSRSRKLSPTICSDSAESTIAIPGNTTSQIA